MKAYIVSTDVTIEPFGDRAADVLLANRPLSEHQRTTFKKVGMDVVTVGSVDEINDTEFFLTYDNVYFSPAVLRRFRKAALAGGRSAVCALPKGAFTDYTDFLRARPEMTDASTGEKVLPYGLFYIKESSFSPDVLASCPPLPLKIRGKTINMPLSEQLEGMQDVNMAITPDVMVEVESWVHIWQLNLYQILIGWVEAVRRNPLRILWRLLLAFPWTNRFRILDKFNLIGRRCRIHPSAVLEGCLIGRGVEIGANCTIRFSILGDGARVQENTVMLASILGAKSRITKRGICNFCLLYPGAEASLIQATFLGRRSLAAGLSRVADLKMGGPIMVEHKGKLVSTRSSFLGGCVGHGAVMVGHVLLAPGRVVPNDYVILPDPKLYLSNIPKDLPKKKVLVVKDGGVVPLR